MAPPGLARPLRWGLSRGAWHPGSHSGSWGVMHCLGTICLPAPSRRKRLCFLPPVIVTICFPPSCLLMFSCFKTEMSQIGS